ncbi:MAG TPA: glutaredoxin family protein [Candidatus Binatia bacterium]|nr:glutaredoxin family protein [Candidatus Binatia bacterium]
MKAELVIYTRKDCCLCDEMKAVIHQVAAHTPLALEEIDVDSAPETLEKYGNEVPVLFINGRKAFKYRVTRNELEKKLKVKGWWVLRFSSGRQSGG